MGHQCTYHGPLRPTVLLGHSSNDPYPLHAEYTSANVSQLLACIIDTNLVNIPGYTPSATVH